jgi:tetratricopeptide (TPR) repeat protein
VLAGRAQDQLNAAVKLDSSNVEARIYLAHYYLNAPSIAGGSKKKALEHVREIIKYEPVEGNVLMAGIHVKDEEYDLAIEKYKSCIAARPENTDYRYRLAMLFQQLEDFDQCFAAFEEILEIDPGSPGALYQMGRTAAISKTNLDRGIECLTEYLAAEAPPGYPGHDAAHWRLGMLFENKGEVSAAKREYKRALEINPGGEEYRKSLASLDGK